KDCDLPGAAEVLTAQKDVFSSFGVNAISQQECVMQHFISGIAALPDSTSGSMDAPTQRVLESSFKVCVPFQLAMASVLHLRSGIPTDAAACIAEHLTGKLSWADLFAPQTPQMKAKIQ